MDPNFKLTPHRAKILSVLQAGDITDDSGYATPKLMEHTGHRTSNALAGVLMQLENAGLIMRDMNGRRTYRIALTTEGRRVAKGLPQNGSVGSRQSVAQEPAAQSVPLDGVDLDLLAGVLLKKALLATQAQEDSAGAKTAAAEVKALRAQVAELQQELKAARSEAAELRAQVKTLEHNNTVLAGQMDKVKKNPGTPITDLISKRERLELDKLMRQLPTARG